MKRASILLSGMIFKLAFGESVLTSSISGPPTTSNATFEFHSGFWVNLHHFLYWQALTKRVGQASRHVSLTVGDTAELENLSSAERATWNSAVTYYQDSLISRDLLFDRGMEAIKNQLEDAETSPDLGMIHLPLELRTVLEKAAPLYRKHWWQKHDSQNQLWIADLKPLLQQHGNSIRDALVRIYDEPWPQQAVRVDAVAYANWAGAYTTLEPTRPTISTSDPANQDTAAIEIVFHESSHGMMNKVMDAINSAKRAENIQHTGGQIHFRRDLWHEVLFYTSGELVTERIPGYVPYADKNELWNRAWPGPDRSLMEKDWKPHMNGTLTLKQALTNLVNDLAGSATPN